MGMAFPRVPLEMTAALNAYSYSHCKNVACTHANANGHRRIRKNGSMKIASNVMWYGNVADCRRVRA